LEESGSWNAESFLFGCKYGQLSEVQEILLICHERSTDDEKSLSSESSRKNAAPSSQFLDFPLTCELGCVDYCSLEIKDRIRRLVITSLLSLCISCLLRVRDFGYGFKYDSNMIMIKKCLQQGSPM
jgi:hypothetical protein